MASFGISETSPIRSDVNSGGSGGSSGGDDPYFVSNNEMTGNPIVGKVLIGQENYGTWRKSMEIALSGRLKLAFIKGKYPRPSDPVMLAKWQRCNDVIMSWLICSVSDKIVGEILHASDVMTAWENLESIYAGTNLARKSALLRELSDCVQNGAPVCDYSRKLNSLYQQIDAISTMKCSAVGNCLCYFSDQRSIPSPPLKVQRSNLTMCCFFMSFFTCLCLSPSFELSSSPFSPFSNEHTVVCCEG